MRLEMEVYYNMIELQSLTVKTLIRIPPITFSKPQFGQTVFVTFRHENELLLLDSIMMTEPGGVITDKYYLEGVCRGSDDSTGEALVGFKFKAADSEKNALDYREHETKVVNVYFTIDNQKLNYDHLALARIEDREPVKFK